MSFRVVRSAKASSIALTDVSAPHIKKKKTIQALSRARTVVDDEKVALARGPVHVAHAGQQQSSDRVLFIVQSMWWEGGNWI